MNRRISLYATAALAAVALGGPAQLGSAEATEQHHHTVVPAAEVEWGPAPPSLPPGAQAAILLGSPAKEGPFVIRLKFPGGYVVPPHRHSKDEFVTVISGKFGVKSGEKIDRASGAALPVGSFFHLPNGMPHYAWADGETIVQINGVGPFDVTYVDPNDDPRRSRSRWRADGRTERRHGDQRSARAAPSAMPPRHQRDDCRQHQDDRATRLHSPAEHRGTCAALKASGAGHARAD